MRKLSQAAHDQEPGSSQNKKSNVTGTEIINSLSVDKETVTSAGKASDMKVDLIQDVVEKDLVVSKAQNKEDKSTALTKKKQSNKTVVKTPSRVTPKEKDVDKDNQIGKLKKSGSKSGSLVKTNSKPLVNGRAKSTAKYENDQSMVNKSAKQLRKVGGTIGNSKDNSKGKSIGKDKPLSRTNLQNSSDKEIPCIEKPVSPDIISSHKNSRGKDSA